MATKKTEETAVDYTSMNAMQKLQIARAEHQKGQFRQEEAADFV